MSPEQELAAELKKCPFCGERPRVYPAEKAGFFMVQCYQCQIETEYLPEGELVKLWNRRTSERTRRRPDAFEWHLIAAGVIMVATFIWFVLAINNAAHESRERMQEALKQYYGTK